MILSPIMVQLDLDTPATGRLTAARDLARRFEAELIGFSVANVRVQVPAEAGQALEDMQRKRRAEEIGERMAGLHKEFLDVAGDGPGTDWIGKIGDPTELLALHARSADLVVVGTPRAGDPYDRERRIDLGSLILSSGRPVLVLSEGEAAPRAETVIVAWKDVREARRAVVDAMPFLLAAKRVIVATVADEGAEVRGSCAAVVRHLIRHGVKAEDTLVPKGWESAAAAIADLARRVGADLVVSGGYGHSRLREWAFGGMTRSLIREGSLNRLLSN